MYGYGYRYSIRPGYVPFNPLTDIDGLQLYLNKNTNVNSKLAIDLDGSTDAVNIDSVLTPLASTTTGYLEAIVTPVDATPTGNEVVLSMADSSAVEFIYLSVETTGKCLISCNIGGVAQWQAKTDNVVFASGVSVKVGLKHDGTTASIYINDILQASTFTTSLDKTKWISNMTVNNFRIGSLDYAGVGNGFWFNGTIQNVKIWSDDTQTTLVASYLFNDANSPYKDYANSYDGTAIGTPTSVVGSQQETTEPLDEVFSWVDQSTNGFIFSQSTVTKQPQLASDGNSIDFDGTDDSLDNSTANVFSGDSSGIVFFSGYFDNTSTNRIICSADNATELTLISFEVDSLGYFRVNSIVDIIRSTNAISNGSYYYGYIKSNGTAYEINLNGTIETPVIVAGSNNGNWFADISSRDNLTIGSVQRLSPVYSKAKPNKIIYSNDHTINTTPILNFLSNPDN